MIVWDIETAPLPIDQLQQIYQPLDVDSLGQPPGEFDPSSVKTGNMKDQAKIEAKIAEAREKHEQDRVGWAAKVEQAKADHWTKFIDRAALDPTTGRVLAIGFKSLDNGQLRILGFDEEAVLLTAFWRLYAKCRSESRRLVGHNIFGFDLPFLVVRSWKHGVDVPADLRRGRYFSDILVDTQQEWLCGRSWGNTCSTLDHVARFFGLDGKNGNGKDFGRLWAEDRPAAEAYLANDLDMIAHCARAMGVL